MKGTSPTRMPVAQIVSITNASRSRPSVLAVRTNARYSPRSSSRSASRKLQRWSRRTFTRHSGRPAKSKNRLSPASMALTVSVNDPAITETYTPHDTLPPPAALPLPAPTRMLRT